MAVKVSGILLLLFVTATSHITSGQDNLPVYLSHGGNNYTSNNSVILITEIEGYDIYRNYIYGYYQLICHTDLVTCCRAGDTGTVGMGEWYYPNGTVVPNFHHYGDGFYRLRNSPQAITLGRHSVVFYGSVALGGLYCCVIPTTIGEQRFCAHILRCPPLFLNNHGVITYTPPDSPEGENTVATYSCNDGYMLIGESTRTCQSDGTWSSTAYCAALCPPLKTPNNGMLNYFNLRNSLLVENFTVATYSCNDGYLLIGRDTRTCQSDRTWSYIDPLCVDYAMVQLKFAPTEHCILWNDNKASTTSSLMRGAIQEAILAEGNITIPLENIDEGCFSCYSYKNQTTYRTKIIGIETASAVKWSGYIQKSVESGVTVKLGWYLVYIDKNCPVSISSLSEPECGQVI